MKKIPKNLIPKDKQEWIGKLYNPFTVPATMFLSKFKWITPNGLSMLVLLFAITAAGLLLYHKFIYAAIFLIAVHFFDAMDGKLARIRGTASKLGEWYDKVTGSVGYMIVFMAFIFTFNSFWLIVSGVVLLGFYSLSVILGNSFYSIVSKDNKKVKMIKNKKWYMRLFGVTLIPLVLILTTLVGKPEFTLYFFALGYLGHFCIMIFFQYRYLKK